MGVCPEDIAAGYELSPDTKREELLRTKGTTSRELIFETLANLDAKSHLLSAGMSQPDLETAISGLWNRSIRIPNQKGAKNEVQE